MKIKPRTLYIIIAAMVAVDLAVIWWAVATL